MPISTELETKHPWVKKIKVRLDDLLCQEEIITKERKYIDKI